MTITEADIACVAKLKACCDALAWLRAEPRTMAQLVEKNHSWARWIIYSAPEPWASRAWAVLLPRADHDDLRTIILCAPEPWKAKAEAVLDRQEINK